MITIVIDMNYMACTISMIKIVIYTNCMACTINMITIVIYMNYMASTINMIMNIIDESRDRQLHSLYYKHVTIVNYDCRYRK